jgi:ATP-binding cassette subfamily F protein uup
VGLGGRGHTGHFADYAQWEDWIDEQRASEQNETQREAISTNTANSANTAKKKLSYIEAREFAVIEEKVAASDVRLAEARSRVENPEIATNAAALQEALIELDAAQHESDALYARWAELTDKAG